METVESLHREFMRQLDLFGTVAFDSIFPAGLIPGSPLPPLAPTVRVLIQVGDQDTEAGPAGASTFWAWLHRHPPDQKR